MPQACLSPTAIAPSSLLAGSRISCRGGSCVGARAPLASCAPLLLLRLCALALLQDGAHAGCPGAAAPGYFCTTSMETLCPVGSFCTGGSAAAMPCMTPANCAGVGLSAEPPCVWNVTTLAGSGDASFFDGQGTAATFNGPSGVAADASGVVYVADANNNRIRAVTPSGLVSTLAGRGTRAWADGTGTAASFNLPNGVATYPGSGIIYVADTYNDRIRKLTPSGVATTFAGSGLEFWADGQGTSASFNRPYGLTVDSAGVVYVADTDNHRIRKITPLGAVTTLAGTGSFTPFSNGVGTITATFHSPVGVAVDGAGNVYVGDTSNNRIRLILPNGTVSTFAGSGSATWADGTGTSAALSTTAHLSFAANGHLFFANPGEYQNINRIRVITPVGVVSTIAGGSTGSFLDGYGTASRFNFPFGVTVDSAGTLYIGELFNHRIRALSCVICPAGYYCSSGVAIVCPAGTFCLPNSNDPAPCPPGTWSSAGSGSCTGCAAVR
jgi:sugar lactone lactonase YvrE